MTELRLYIDELDGRRWHRGLERGGVVSQCDGMLVALNRQLRDVDGIKRHKKVGCFCTRCYCHWIKFPAWFLRERQYS